MEAVMSMSRRKKVSRAVRTLDEIGKMVDWEALVEVVAGLDRTRGGKAAVHLKRQTTRKSKTNELKVSIPHEPTYDNTNKLCHFAKDIHPFPIRPHIIQVSQRVP
jgi:hypothetical protein